MLFNSIIYIYNYSEKKVHIALYVDIVKQVLIIFDLRLTFVKGLIKTIKKNKH